MMEFRSYGTIENPTKECFKVNMQRCVPFDGEFNLEAIMSPPKPILNENNTKFEILDLSK